MGGRWHMQVDVMVSDVAEFLSVIGVEPDYTEELPDQGRTVLEFWETNRAMHKGREEAARKGCVFCGWHADGAERYMFAAADKRMLEHPADENDVFVPVLADASGRVFVSKKSLEFAQSFHDLRVLVEERFKEEANRPVEVLLNFIDGTSCTLEVAKGSPLAQAASWSVHMDKEPSNG